MVAEKRRVSVSCSMSTHRLTSATPAKARARPASSPDKRAIVIDCRGRRNLGVFHMSSSTRFRNARAALALALAAAAAGAATPSADVLAPERLAPVLDYIRKSWGTLTRSNAGLAVAARDPKMPRAPEGPFPVYLSRKEDRARVEAALAAILPAAERAKIELRTLPEGPLAADQHGLLYLPRPYVVPGGRFNEMYGWDSYFIQVGLLRER